MAAISFCFCWLFSPWDRVTKRSPETSRVQSYWSEKNSICFFPTLTCGVFVFSSVSAPSSSSSRPPPPSPLTSILSHIKLIHPSLTRTHSLTHSLTPSLARSLARSLTHSLMISLHQSISHQSGGLFISQYGRASREARNEWRSIVSHVWQCVAVALNGTKRKRCLEKLKGQGWVVMAWN